MRRGDLVPVATRGLTISLSSVKRTLDRYKLTNHWSKWKKRRTNTPRPKATAPGELVEVDTVHYVNQLDGKRVYITTVIDLYSRMAYTRPSYKLLLKWKTPKCVLFND